MKIDDTYPLMVMQENLNLHKDEGKKESNQNSDYNLLNNSETPFTDITSCKQNFSFLTSEKENDKSIEKEEIKIEEIFYNLLGNFMNYLSCPLVALIELKFIGMTNDITLLNGYSL